MKIEMFCSKINKEVFLTFDSIKTGNTEEPNQYLIGLASNCSVCGKKICKDCSLAKALVNQSINL